jgi:hypothetical protein
MTFELYWPETATAEAKVATQFGIMSGDAGASIYLLVGHAAPPPWFTGRTREEGRAASGGRVQVQLQGSFYMTRANAVSLYEALRSHFALESKDD